MPQALRPDHLTALRKESVGIREIVTGENARRKKILMTSNKNARAMPTRPFHQGSHRMHGLLRLITDMNGDSVIISLEGIGAFEKIKRN